MDTFRQIESKKIESKIVMEKCLLQTPQHIGGSLMRIERTTEHACFSIWRSRPHQKIILPKASELED